MLSGPQWTFHKRVHSSVVTAGHCVFLMFDIVPASELALPLVGPDVASSVCRHAVACGIRGKAATDSDGRRPSIPIESGHPIRTKAATPVDRVRQGALSAI